MTTKRLTLGGLLALFLALPAPAADNAPYLDPTRPIEARVADLVGRMTAAEKIDQLSSTAPALERLGIPAYDYWNESLHGVARAGRATIFPQAIGMAATFDPDLVRRVATVISDEARAKHNASVHAGFRDRYRGLTFWTPNINIFRDPRWGRGQETYGEDPFLTARMGSAYVRGLQGDDDRYLKAAACAKHYAVHSGPEGLRHGFDAIATPKDLHETYLPAFEALVDAGVEIVMCAYNRTNGDPCCGSDFLLQETLRDSWGFDGHVVSDCGAVNDLHQGHKVTKDAAESAAVTLKAGTDLACTSYAALHEAFERHLVTEADLDRALSRVLRTRFRLGLFDPESMVPWSSVPDTVIGSDAHRQLSREAAVKSMVLLKNQDGLLPLSKDLRMVYVTGPLAADAQVMIGNYYGLNEDIATVLEGVMGKVSAATKVDFRQGALLDRANVNPADWFSGSAREADVTIAVVGVSNLLEGEEGASIASPDKGDRFDISLPENQVAFVKKMGENAKKLVVVVLSGSPVAMPEVHELADAVVFAWYPGMEGGRAIADVLFGDAVPSGRLPLTFPKSMDQLPPYEDYSMKGRTYRYMTKEPLYPFGFGLSTTTFSYGELELSKETVGQGGDLTASVRVTNEGDRAGEEVVQLYVSALDASVAAPLAALKAFQRVSVDPGQSAAVRFTVTPEMLAVINDEGEPAVGPGRFRLTVGGASPGARAVALGAPKPAEAVVTVE
ncbi:MAG: glycoside hydrolase family 3 C-terminal domain-containing protein [Acidobacteria bacterium]|nr:glycoside hydrolase family 3 C-terminal domain-containing protein [Acidobacteriota bacterium]